MGNKKRAVWAEGALFNFGNNFGKRGCQPSIRQNPAGRFLAVAAVDWMATPVCDVTNKNNIRYSAGLGAVKEVY